MRELLMKPWLPTSNGHRITLQPFCVHSKTRSVYLSLLYSLATSMLSSQGTVSSPTTVVFAFLDHITRSGLRSVRAISCGNISWVSRSISNDQSFAAVRIPPPGFTIDTNTGSISLTKLMSIIRGAGVRASLALFDSMSGGAAYIQEYLVMSPFIHASCQWNGTAIKYVFSCTSFMAPYTPTIF